MDEFMLNCVITRTPWNISILMHHFTARVNTHFQVIFQFNSSPFKFDAIKSRSLHNTSLIVVCDSGLAVKPFLWQYACDALIIKYTIIYYISPLHLGNNCIFEYNSLSGLCYEVTDSGGFYTGRSWIDRGNTIRHSQFSNIRTTEKTSLGSPSVQAIYLDDQVVQGWSDCY